MSLEGEDGGAQLRRCQRRGGRRPRNQVSEHGIGAGVMAPVVAGMLVLELHLAVVFLVASSNLVNAAVLLAHGPVKGVVLIGLRSSLSRSSGSPPLVPTNAQSQDDNGSEDGETTLEGSASGRLGVQVVGIGPGVGGRGHGCGLGTRTAQYRTSKRCGTGDGCPRAALGVSQG